MNRARALTLASGIVALVATQQPGWAEGPHGLSAVAHWLSRCANTDARPLRVPGGAACTSIVYVWSAAMPLSAAGMEQIRRAGAALGIGVGVLSAQELEQSLGEALEPTPARFLAAAIASSGGTAHYPAVLVYRHGLAQGSAILGFKTAGAYRALLARRLISTDVPTVQERYASFDRLSAAPTAGRILRDIAVGGSPEAYFRFAPRHDSVIFTQAQRVRMLNIGTQQVSTLAGYVDFIPSPDGRLFVTPGPNRAGLQFFSERQVVATERPETWSPVLTDPAMRDQYPSIGILAAYTAGSGARYRVVTSWLDRAAFRDYQVRVEGPSGDPSVEPAGERVALCSNLTISLPIVSHSGRELAARDEATGTTKLFALGDDGRCTELLDLDLSTTKVGWSPDGSRLAFSISRRGVTIRPGASDSAVSLTAGVFIFDRRTGTLTRVAGSEGATQLVFADFVDASRVIFMARNADTAAFRIVGDL